MSLVVLLSPEEILAKSGGYKWEIGDAICAKEWQGWGGFENLLCVHDLYHGGLNMDLIINLLFPS